VQPLTAFDLVYDSWIDDKPVPNLVDSDTLLNDYTHLRYEYPYVVDCSLERWCHEHQYPVRHYRLDDPYPAPSFYPIELAKFDIKTDYFALMTESVRRHLDQGRLLAVFFCWDAVDVFAMRQLLEAGAKRHNLPWNCYRVVVNNSMVDLQVPWFFSFVDSELSYWSGNSNHAAINIDSASRRRDFTVLSRMHQPWRALAMTQFQRARLLDNAYWSYGNLDLGQGMGWDPLHVDRIPDITQADIDKFLASAPYKDDDTPLGQQGDARTLIEHQFNGSWLHVVIETTLDAQGGATLSEKTFKPIKHGQPFVILGTVNSLLRLKSLGYRTFDNTISAGYDHIWDHNQRYLTVYRLLRDLKTQGLESVFAACRDDIEHNQRLFLANKQERLSFLQGILEFHYLYTNNDYGDFGIYEEIFQPWHR
jgi:hypothetical protein